MQNAKQFDVYLNPDLSSVKFYPYLVVLQYFGNVDTRIIGPRVLLRKVKNLNTHHINPVVIINDQQYVILKQLLIDCFSFNLY